MNGDIFVNGLRIERHAVRREAQYHPAPSWEVAEREAGRALVVRALLLQEAERRGLGAPPASGEHPEARAQATIQRLIEREVPVPQVDEASCRAYYERHRARFRTPEVFEASHILFAAPELQPSARGRARAQAERTLDELRRAPGRFEQLARQRSSCPSASQGGSLGQLTRGECLPAFEAALDDLEPGQLRDEPLETIHGYHVVRLDQRVSPSQAPYGAVRARVQIYLRDARWRRDLRDYISALAERATIEGFALPAQGPAPPRGDQKYSGMQSVQAPSRQ